MNEPTPEKTAADTPIVEIVEKLRNPESELTPAERNAVRNLTGNVDSAVKTSLVQLLMGRFNKVAAYDDAINKVLAKLMEKLQIMDPDELVAMLTTLAKVSASESKNVLELFKKSGDNIEDVIKSLRKESVKKTIDTDPRDDKNIIDMSPEKTDKILRLIDKLGQDGKLVDVEEE